MVKEEKYSSSEIPVHPLEKEKFSLFGDVIQAHPSHKNILEINNRTVKRYHDLARIESHGTRTPVLFNIFRGTAFSLPVHIHMMERHPYSSQAFFPLDNRPFLVVAAQDMKGRPQKPQAFLALPGQGINYRPNTWHHPLLTLGKTSDFIVIDHIHPGHNSEEYFYDVPYRISNQKIHKTMQIEELNIVSSEIFCSVLSNIFENSPWVAKNVVCQRPFCSMDALYLSMISEINNADEQKKTDLICSHPDLAGAALKYKTLTRDSADEQKKAGLDQLTNEELAEFDQLNRCYKKRFGFPFILAIRGNSKPHDKFSILANLHKRLHNSYIGERQEALRQISCIAKLRLKEIIKG